MTKGPPVCRRRVGVNSSVSIPRCIRWQGRPVRAAIMVTNSGFGAKVILATVTDAKSMSSVLAGLGVDGRLVVLGVGTEPIEAAAMLLISGRRSISGWPSGIATDSEDTLKFSVLTGVRSMNEVYPLDRVAEAYERMLSGKARFRVVLTTAA